MAAGDGGVEGDLRGGVWGGLFGEVTNRVAARARSGLIAGCDWECFRGVMLRSWIGSSGSAFVVLNGRDLRRALAGRGMPTGSARRIR